MYHTVVMTCGTSFNAPENLFSIVRNLNNLPFEPLNLHKKEMTDKEKKDIDTWLSYCKMIADQKSVDPAKISAEYSTVYALKQRKKIINNPTIVLFVTETIGGYMVEKLLHYLFKKEFQATIRVLFVTIDVTNAKIFNQQIGEFMSKLSDALREGEPSSTCFAPLGGYKVMTSYGYIVGSVLKYPTIYLNDFSQLLIEIPWVPLNVDNRFIEEYASLLRKCFNYTYLEKLSLQEQDIVTKYPYLFEIADDLVSLTPFGIFLMQQSDREHVFGTQYYFSAQVQKLLKNRQDQKTFVAGQLQELVQKLKLSKRSDFDLMHEKEFDSMNQEKVKYHLYKGSSNGNQTIFRLAYRYDEQLDELYANYLWLDHNDYEREASKGKGLYDEEKNFVNFTDKMVQLKRS